MEVEVELRASSHEVYNFSADKAGQSDLADARLRRLGNNDLPPRYQSFLY